MLNPEEIIDVARLEHDNEAGKSTSSQRTAECLTEYPLEISADSAAYTADIIDKLKDTSKVGTTISISDDLVGADDIRRSQNMAMALRPYRWLRSIACFRTLDIPWKSTFPPRLQDLLLARAVSIS